METNDLRKAAEMALEDICGAKLCEVNSMSSRAEMLRLMDKAAEALRQALAEPVLYMDSKQMPEGMPDWKPGMVFPKPKREWVGLTDEERHDVLEDATGDGGHVYYDTLFRTIEAKLKEKNI